MWDDHLILDRFCRALKGCTYYGPVQTAEIDAAEKELGVRFPLSYRLFLREFGAAWLKSYEIAGLAPGRHTDPEPPLWEHVIDVTEIMRRAGRGYLPQTYVKVSDDGCEYYFYLDTGRMDQRGECPVVVLGPGFDAVFVAPSFLEFVEKIVAGDPLEGLAK